VRECAPVVPSVTESRPPVSSKGFQLGTGKVQGDSEKVCPKVR